MHEDAFEPARGAFEVERLVLGQANLERAMSLRMLEAPLSW
jgi:hypothetical protein